MNSQPIGFDVPVTEPGLPAVTFVGVSTLLFDDGDRALLFDGFFSRPSLVQLLTRRIRPDAARIAAGLTRLGIADPGRLAAVIPVYSHYDHALDSAEVARRTGALLVGGTSTLNLGRGGGVPAARLRQATEDEPIQAGAWRLRFVESSHCPPDRFPGTIDAPLTPPARVSAYRCAEAWSVLVEHMPSGRTALVQGSAGFVRGALHGVHADVAYLGVGQLGVRPVQEIRDYWAETVEAVGAQRVVLTHWDDFLGAVPLRALPYAGDDLDVTCRLFADLARRQGVAVHLPTPWTPESPWSRLEP